MDDLLKLVMFWYVICIISAVGFIGALFHHIICLY